MDKVEEEQSQHPTFNIIEIGPIKIQSTDTKLDVYALSNLAIDILKDKTIVKVLKIEEQKKQEKEAPAYTE